jgi:multidrug efflux pump subunit AcrA (membrane-fusion protein)
MPGSKTMGAMNRPRARLRAILGWALCSAFCLSLGGCGEDAEGEQQNESSAQALPAVHAVSPERRKIVRNIEVPGMLESYEQTAMYAKIPGYVEKWYFDLGAHVKKGDLLLTLEVPELVEQNKQKQAMIAQSQAAVKQAKQQVVIMQHQVQMARDVADQAGADVGRYQAAVERWQSEYDRLVELAKMNAVDKRVVDEALENLQTKEAELTSARFTVRAKETEHLSAEAALEKARTDIDAAETVVQAAQADERHTAALLAYSRMTAPYDAVITARNVSTGDLVRPAASLGNDTPLSADGGPKAVPPFVLARMDRVMFVAGLPELDAGYIAEGTPVRITVQSLGIAEIRAKVSRTSWAIRNRNRTLEVQVDVPIVGTRLVPGMYATSVFTISQDDPLVIPATAIVYRGTRATCYLIEDGKVHRVQVETGLTDGKWTEVLRQKVETGPKAGQWVAFDEHQHVVADRTDELSDGAKIELAANTAAR